MQESLPLFMWIPLTTTTERVAIVLLAMYENNKSMTPFSTRSICSTRQGRPIKLGSAATTGTVDPPRRRRRIVVNAPIAVQQIHLLYNQTSAAAKTVRLCPFPLDSLTYFKSNRSALIGCLGDCQSMRIYSSKNKSDYPNGNGCDSLWSRRYRKFSATTTTLSFNESSRLYQSHH
jgi:hypothetical protein